MNLPGRRLGLHSSTNLSSENLKSLINRSLELSRGADPRSFSGRNAILAFFESSTRTKVSFEVAATQLGMVAINFDITGSSLSKGESIKDTAETLASYDPSLFVVRSKESGLSQLFEDWTSVPTINAGDGEHEHPTQAILDLTTLVERFGSLDALEGLQMAIVGDVLHSRVARSLVQLASTCGIEVSFVGPESMMPKYIFPNVVRHSSFEVERYDVLYMLRIQRERFSEGESLEVNKYRSRFSLTKERASHIRRDQVVMHPGPVFPGMEIDAPLIDIDNSLIRRQTEVSIFARMAIIEAVLEGSIDG
ncbi:MAG: aspartate carbamoyltransferase catalytic subunit [Actinomycetota bacterium]|nr:aspartate carbamoyltransferase catalytic subunit [Actinomycetota bacterium]